MAEEPTINDSRTVAGGGAMLAGRYRVVRQIGQGGMGSVWLAEDTQLDNKPFAIKMLPSILVANKRAYRQLKDEALVAMKLTHPNIVTLRAFEENNGNPFLVMDYIDGQTLDDYLAEKGNLGEDETIRLLKPIAAALDYAHGEGVVHRDVKPANVMIRTDGHPFILDFGIAREIQETLTRVTGKLSSGTLLYMSPEQLNGAQPKPPQDVYSFAAMVYECLKGEPPFVRGQIEYQIINAQPEPLIGIGISLSVLAGLAKKPSERPPSCVEVLVTGNQPLGQSQSHPKVKIEDSHASGSFTKESLRISPQQKPAMRKPLKDAFRNQKGEMMSQSANSGNRKLLLAGLLFVFGIVVCSYSYYYTNADRQLRRDSLKGEGVLHPESSDKLKKDNSARLAAEHLVAENARREALTARDFAEAVAASSAASAQWKLAEDSFRTGTQEFQDGYYDQAAKSWAIARRIYDTSAAFAKTVEKVDSKAQQDVTDSTADKMERQGKGSPIARLVAKVDGVEVDGAQFAFNGRSFSSTKTFCELPFKDGETFGPISVKWQSSGGERYSGNFGTITANWQGVKVWHFPLTREMPKPRPPTMSTAQLPPSGSGQKVENKSDTGNGANPKNETIQPNRLEMSDARLTQKSSGVVERESGMDSRKTQERIGKLTAEFVNFIPYVKDNEGKQYVNASVYCNGVNVVNKGKDDSDRWVFSVSKTNAAGVSLQGKSVRFEYGNRKAKKFISVSDIGQDVEVELR